MKKNNTSYKIIIVLLVFLLLVLSIMLLIEIKPQNNIVDIVETNNVSVFMKKDVFDELKYRYSINHIEYMYCIDGIITNNSIIITHITPVVPRNVSDSSLEYMSSDCKGSLGTLHNHPTSSYCLPSYQDVYSWGRTHDLGYVLHIIQCKKTFYVFLEPKYGTKIHSYNKGIKII